MIATGIANHHVGSWHTSMISAVATISCRQCYVIYSDDDEVYSKVREHVQYVDVQTGAETHITADKYQHMCPNISHHQIADAAITKICKTDDDEDI